MNGAGFSNSMANQQYANAMTIRGPQLIEAMVIQQMS